MKKIKYLSIAIIFVVTSLSFAATLNAENIARISKEQLMELFDKPDLIILDVRTKRDWKASKYKIKGAERAAPGYFNSWISRYPKDKTIVLYCAWDKEYTSAWMAQKLVKKGYARVYALKGGWHEWYRAKFPVEEK